MGHERLGALPRTREWRQLVESIASATSTTEATPGIASATLLRVRRRFEDVPLDAGFRAAFSFMLGLTTSETEHEVPAGTSALYPQIDLDANPTTIRLTSQLRAWVDDHTESLEYGELSKRAAADAIVFWSRRHAQQSELFADANTAAQVWATARSAGAFSELCRTFFGRFTARYLKYFLHREASAQLPTIEARDAFEAGLDRHIDDIARHAFEATKITQSFSAGWYNAHARKTRPNKREIDRFLGFAMAKLRAELLRESARR